MYAYVLTEYAYVLTERPSSGAATSPSKLATTYAKYTKLNCLCSGAATSPSKLAKSKT